MIKLTETQTIILSAGAQRPENIALPLPKGLAGAAAKMAVTKMIEHGWLQEVDANLRRNEPLWRETGDGHGTTLVVTDGSAVAPGVGAEIREGKLAGCGITFGAKIVGHDAGPVRPPLTDLKAAEVEQLAALIKALGPQ